MKISPYCVRFHFNFPLINCLQFFVPHLNHQVAVFQLCKFRCNCEVRFDSKNTSRKYGHLSWQGKLCWEQKEFTCRRRRGRRAFGFHHKVVLICEIEILLKPNIWALQFSYSQRLERLYCVKSGYAETLFSVLLYSLKNTTILPYPGDYKYPGSYRLGCLWFWLWVPDWLCDTKAQNWFTPCSSVLERQSWEV